MNCCLSPCGQTGASAPLCSVIKLTYMGCCSSSCRPNPSVQLIQLCTTNWVWWHSAIKSKLINWMRKIRDPDCHWFYDPSMWNCKSLVNDTADISVQLPLDLFTTFLHRIHYDQYIMKSVITVLNYSENSRISLDFVCASLWVCNIFGGHHALWKCATWCKGNSQDPLFLFSAADSTKFQFGIDCCSYEAAARWLRKALSLAPPPLTEAWEPTVVNLAHTLRKLKYDMCDVSIFLALYACMLKVSYVWSIPLPASVCLYASLGLQCAPDLWLK